MNKIAVGIGEVLWDIFPDKRTIGGAPANFVYHAAQFGLDSYIVSAVGNDALGNETENILKDKGLKSCIPHIDYPTGQLQFPWMSTVYRNMIFKNRLHGIIFPSLANWNDLLNIRALSVSVR